MCAGRGEKKGGDCLYTGRVGIATAFYNGECNWMIAAAIICVSRMYSIGVVNI